MSKQKLAYKIVCQSKTPFVDNEIREEHLKHIEELTKDLSPLVIEEIAKYFDYTTLQFEELTYRQQQWLTRRMYSPMGKPWKSGNGGFTFEEFINLDMADLELLGKFGTGEQDNKLTTLRTMLKEEMRQGTLAKNN